MRSTLAPSGVYLANAEKRAVSVGWTPSSGFFATAALCFLAKRLLVSFLFSPVNGFIRLVVGSCCCWLLSFYLPLQGIPPLKRQINHPHQEKMICRFKGTLKIKGTTGSKSYNHLIHASSVLYTP